MQHLSHNEIWRLFFSNNNAINTATARRHKILSGYYRHSQHTAIPRITVQQLSFRLLQKCLLLNGLEVLCAYITPLFRILQLMRKTGGDFLKTLLVNVFAHVLPLCDITLHLRNANVVMHNQLMHDAATVAQTICPRDMVEPKKILLRAGFNVVVQ